VYYLVTRTGTGQAPAATKTIVVAATDIAARSQITADMVRTEVVPDDPAFARVVTSPAAVIDQFAAIAIAAGDPITPNMVGVGSAAGFNILEPGETIGPDTPDWRAVSVEVPRDRAVGGFIQKGDTVDVFATLSIRIYDTEGELTDNALLPQGYYSDTTTKVTWTDLQVLDVDTDNDLYVLRVDQHQAEEIAHVQGSGANSFTLSLRATADNRDVDRAGYGETTNRILEEYNFPIPQIIDLGSYPQPSPGAPTAAP
jgi:Flp pilus assembly protein CpaB